MTESFNKLIEGFNQLLDLARASPWPTLVASITAILGGLILRAFLKRRLRSLTCQLEWYVGDLNRHFIEQFHRAAALRTDIPVPMQQVHSFALKHAEHLEYCIRTLFPLLAKVTLGTIAVGVVATLTVPFGGALRAWSFLAVMAALSFQAGNVFEIARNK